MSMASRKVTLFMSISLPGSRAFMLAMVSSKMRTTAGKPFLHACLALYSYIQLCNVYNILLAAETCLHVCLRA